MRRVLLWSLWLTSALVALPATADAEYRGTDLWGNIAPGVGGLVDRYPSSHYALDYHVEGIDVGLTGVHGNDVTSQVAQFFVSLGFTIMTWFVRMVLTIFDWAFNLDLIGGKHGLLGPVGRSSQHLYSTAVVPLMATAFLLLGAWMTIKMLQRRHSELAAGVVRAVCMTVVVLVIVFNPSDTVGRASGLVNDLSSEIVSSSLGGGGSTSASDQLFKVLVYQPWVVLQFGGFEVCTGSHVDKHGFPTSVRPDAPGRKTCHDVLEQGADGHGGYAPRFLRQAPGSAERDAEYDALNKGVAPLDPQFRGYQVDRTDSPAVDLMQAGGTVQRAAGFCLLLVGIVGGVLLIGLLCFAALFVQLALLLLIAVAPLAVLPAIFPNGHGVLNVWLGWLGKMLIAKVIYSVMLAAVVGLSTAVMSFGGAITYLAAFAIQGALFLGLFLMRGRIFSKVTGSSSRREYDRHEKRMTNFVAGAATGAVAAVGTTATSVAKRGLGAGRQESSGNPDDKRGTHEPPVTTGLPADSSSPPASAGRDYSPPGKPWDLPVTSDADQMRRWRESSTTVATMRGEDDAMPTRTFTEDLKSERSWRSRPYADRPATPPVAPTGPPATRENLGDDLERERRRQRPVAAPET